MSNHTLLLADHDRELRQRLARELTADGYIVVHVPSEGALGSALLATAADLLVLGDFDGPGANARLLGELRSGELTGEPETVPVLVLADDAQLLALMRCFEAGADEFQSRAVSYIELRARMRAILRRSAHVARPRRLRVGPLMVDLAGQRAAWGGQPLDLSRMEFSLLACLASEPARVWTKNELLRDVWGYLSIGRTRTVDAHACRLRRKLANAGASGWILNIRGIGYRLADHFDVPPSDADAA